jgi:hypothetical protein
MSGELTALGALVAGSDWRAAEAAERLAIERGIRASLLCVLLGLEREAATWPYPAQAAAGRASKAGKMLADLFEPMDAIGQLATLAGAADLDPMDPGPSHTVLPATLAACIASSLASPPADAQADDDDVGAAVLAGVEAAWRMRRAVSGARPGVGFHSPGVYGAVAAAAAGARTWRLGEVGCANAMAIALTRASGLALNSAASTIGMTHFGWGAAHGLEAALLACEGWDASHDVQRALASLFGEGHVNLDAMLQPGGTAAAGLVFKRYPCNIYLNLMVLMLDEVPVRPVDRIEITMPWIPHLDNPAPRDVRQARNSAQAVAAIAGCGDTSYAAFSGAPGPWRPAADVARLLPDVVLVADRAAPTRLSEARVGVRAWRGGSLVQDSTRAMRDLGSWGVEHARKLMGSDARPGEVDALYGGSLLQGYEHVRARRLAQTGQQRSTRG